MNRQERRKNKDAAKPKVYTLTEDQIKQIRYEERNKAIDAAFTAMLGLPLLALRDVYGFGKERLERFIDNLLEKYDSFREGYITLEDLQQTIKDETGVELKKGK